MSDKNSVFFVGGRKFSASLSDDQTTFSIKKTNRGVAGNEEYEINIKLTLSNSEIFNSVGDYEDLEKDPGTDSPDLEKLNNLVYITNAYKEGTKEANNIELKVANLKLSAIPSGRVGEDDFPLSIQINLESNSGGKTNNGGVKTNNGG